MSQLGLIIRKVFVKITSVRDEDDNMNDLLGKIVLADYVMHQGDGVYSCQVQVQETFYLTTNCRIRFIKEMDYPEYFL